MKSSLAKEPPPLVDMEEPLELRAEPTDEVARIALELGVFTGIRVANRGDTLDALMEASEGVLVDSVVENSPADQAGITPGDVVLEVSVSAADPTHGRKKQLKWPSEWRELELSARSGAKFTLLVDRAGAQQTLELVAVPRVHPADRSTVEHFREEENVGVVLRTATEVEARGAGLGPGGGAVIIGLSRASPWRKAGLVFEDMIVAVNGEKVAHPQVLIDAIRANKVGQKLTLEVARGGSTRTVVAAVGKRAHELREFSIPFLYTYAYDRGHSETSVLFGIYKHESTKAAWRTRILWFIDLKGGEADRLQEEGS